MKWKRGLLASIVYLVIAEILHTLGAFLTMNYYLDPTHFPVWSQIVMPAGGAPGATFYVLSIIFTFITALLIVWVYSKVEKAIPGSGYKKGVYYGGLVFLLAGIPALFSMSLFINLPGALIASWTVEGLIINLLGGAALGKIYG